MYVRWAREAVNLHDYVYGFMAVLPPSIQDRVSIDVKMDAIVLFIQYAKALLKEESLSTRVA